MNGIPVFSRRLAALALASALAAPGGAAQASAEDDLMTVHQACQAARDQVGKLPALWQEGQLCGDLAEDKAAVRPDPWGAGLKKFREVKADFLSNFDTGNPYTAGAVLDELSTAAAAYIKAHPEKGETGAELRTLVDRIKTLNAAVGALRPDGQTTHGRLSAIDAAMARLQDTCTDVRDGQHYSPTCLGPGILDKLARILPKNDDPASDEALAAIRAKVEELTTGTGAYLGATAHTLDRMRSILTCRQDDEQLKQSQAKANQPECKNDLVVAPQGSYVRQQMEQAVRFCQANPLVNDCPNVLKQTDLVAVYGSNAPKPDAVTPAAPVPQTGGGTATGAGGGGNENLIWVTIDPNQPATPPQQSGGSH